MSITYTGVHVTPEFGAPGVRDIAVQLMRIARFGGAGRIFWPVGMHSILVGGLLPAELRIYGYLHDAEEACTGDVQRPFKTATQSFSGEILRKRTFRHLGLAQPLAKEVEAIHAADLEALRAERMLGCGPRGFTDTHPDIKPTKRSVRLLSRILADYEPKDAIDPDGKWPRYFERIILRELRKHHNLASAYTGGSPTSFATVRLDSTPQVVGFEGRIVSGHHRYAAAKVVQ